MNSRWGPASKSELLSSKLAPRQKQQELETPDAIARHSCKSHSKCLLPKLSRAESATPSSTSRSSSRQIEDAEPVVMLRRRTPRPSTADAATQTGEERVIKRAMCPCVGCGRVVRPPPDAVLALAKAPSGSSSSEVGGGERKLARTPGAERRHRNAQRCPSPHVCAPRVWVSSPPFLKNDDDDHPLLSPTGAKRNLNELMAETREVLLEAVLATTRSPSPTPTRASLKSPFPVRPKSPPRRRPMSRSSASSYYALAVGGARAAVDPILDSLEDESDILRPRDVRSYIINDQLGLIYERIEAKWSEVCNEVKTDSDNKYNKFLADCQFVLDAQKDDAGREELREDIEAAWRRLTAELKDKFRDACISFNEWRTRFVERDLRTSCSLLRRGDRLRLLAAALRYELVDSLPELEKRTQVRATQFWKQMVDERHADLEALFASDSD